MVRKLILRREITLRLQRGAALLLFFLAVLLTGTIILATNISRDRAQIDNEEITTDALAQAKQALIAYAATYHDRETVAGAPRAGLMGFLPCPDSAASAEGTSPTNCEAQYNSAFGMLPWKSLGISPLKDGSGNCLWYAVSGEYKNSGRLDRLELADPSPAGGLSRSEMLNDDTNGVFELFDKAGTQLKGNSPENRAVAMIIAPGKPVAGQTRTTAANTQCGGDYTASQFLEIFNAIDNADTPAGTDALDDFVASERTNDNDFNDRIITISQQEIFEEIKKRSDFNALMQNTTRELAECIAEFGLSNPQPPGGCDATCIAQCDAERATCLNCRNQCNIDRNACVAAGTRPNICNQIRNNCRRACLSPGQCNAAYNVCITGGAGGNDFRLPWPAPVALADYRDSQLYVEDAVSGNHLGRFPVDVSNAVVETGNIFSGQYLLESDFSAVNAAYTNCRDLNTDALGVAPAYNSVERRIWQNWKDHFFYAVAGDYAATAANVGTPAVGACTNCLSVNGGATPYAAIVIFSDERVAGQARTVLPNDVDTKQDITNYLEGNNATNYLGPENAAGNGDYQTGTTNDFAYCINEDMTVVQCP